MLENEVYKILWDFETQTDPLILARRLVPEIFNKNLPSSSFCPYKASGLASEQKKERNLNMWMAVILTLIRLSERHHDT